MLVNYKLVAPLFLIFSYPTYTYILIVTFISERYFEVFLPLLPASNS